MNLLACLKNKLKSEQGFSLLELVFVITISTIIAAVFLQQIILLYQDNNFFNLHTAWYLDSYLAVDFIADKIKNAKQINIISESEIEIYTFYNNQYQWLKFSLYQRGDSNNLARAIGGTDFNDNNFGRKLSLLDNIEALNFKIIENNLLEIKIILKNKKEELIVSKIIKI